MPFVHSFRACDDGIGRAVFLEITHAVATLVQMKTRATQGGGAVESTCPHYRVFTCAR